MRGTPSCTRTGTQLSRHSHSAPTCMPSCFGRPLHPCAGHRLDLLDERGVACVGGVLQVPLEEVLRLLGGELERDGALKQRTDRARLAASQLHVEVDGPDVDALGVGGEHAVKDGAAPLRRAVPELELPKLGDDVDVVRCAQRVDGALQQLLGRRGILSLRKDRLEPREPHALVAPEALERAVVRRVCKLGVAGALVRRRDVQVDAHRVRLRDGALEEGCERLLVAEALLQVQHRRPQVVALALGRELDGAQRALANLARALQLGERELQLHVVHPQPRVGRLANEQPLVVLGGRSLARRDVRLALAHLRLALAPRGALLGLPAAPPELLLRLRLLRIPPAGTGGATKVVPVEAARNPAAARQVGPRAQPGERVLAAERLGERGRLARPARPRLDLLLLRLVEAAPLVAVHASLAVVHLLLLVLVLALVLFVLVLLVALLARALAAVAAVGLLAVGRLRLLLALRLLLLLVVRARQLAQPARLERERDAPLLRVRLEDHAAHHVARLEGGRQVRQLRVRCLARVAERVQPLRPLALAPAVQPHKDAKVDHLAHKPGDGAAGV
mmetsp:Transcript_36526/g.118803  ORF Transcript_36526/g.118803 Transcript_36526/m.118803 type:complete len:562 (-) Transcript_36526:974-2659(-)